MARVHCWVYLPVNSLEPAFLGKSRKCRRIPGTSTTTQEELRLNTVFTFWTAILNPKIWCTFCISGPILVCFASKWMWTRVSRNIRNMENLSNFPIRGSPMVIWKSSIVYVVLPVLEKRLVSYREGMSSWCIQQLLQMKTCKTLEKNHLIQNSKWILCRYYAHITKALLDYLNSSYVLFENRKLCRYVRFAILET